MKLPEFWKTGVLLLVLAGAFSYIWFVERKQEPKPEGEREKVTVLAVDKAKAKEITLAAAGGETLRLVKEGTGLEGRRPLRRPRRHLGGRVPAHEPREARGRRGRGGAGGEPGRVRPRQAEPHRQRRRGGRPRATLRPVRREVPGRLERLRPHGVRAEGLPRAPVGRGRLRQEALRPARPGPPARQARRRALPGGGRARRAATRSRGPTPASGPSRSPSPRAPAAGRWTASSAPSRTCAWSRWRRTRRRT